jgi:ubiquinone/menaquinone biosynthesis C-methylase UbiE
VADDEPAGEERQRFRPSPETFDEAFARAASGRTMNEMFDRVMGPFPANVEPYSLVTREGLNRVLAELRLEPDDHLVDLCCGRGGIGLWFARESDARLTGIDFSPTAIAESRRRSELFLPDGRASFVVADAAVTPLDRRSADAVVCIDALQMLPDREAALREAGSLLRGDGRIVLTTWEVDESPSGRTPLSDVGQVVEAAGLRLVLREEHPEWLARQNELYESAIAADAEDAEPAVRALADEARTALPIMENARRVLVVATSSGAGS